MKSKIILLLAVLGAVVANFQADAQEKKFKVFKTIKIGTYKSVNSIAKDLEKKECSISGWASEIFENSSFVLVQKEEFVDLVVVSGEELGFSDPATYEDICKKASASGLSLCRAEVGPQLRLQYLNQPRKEFLRIAMEPIYCSGKKTPSIFLVGSGNGELWLTASGGAPDVVWSLDSKFVFCLVK